MTRLLYNILLRIQLFLSRFRKSDDLQKEELKRILVIQLTKLGDLVSTLPLFPTLKEFSPDASLSALVNSGHTGLFAAVPMVDEVLTTSSSQNISGILDILRKIRRHRFDLVISSSPAFRHGLITLLSGARFKYGFLDYTRAKVIHLQGHRLRAIGFRLRSKVNGRHPNITERVNRLSLGLGIQQLNGIDPLVLVRREAVEENQLLTSLDLTRDSHFIVIHPFASWVFRTWPVDNFKSLMSRILEKFEEKIVVIASETERARTQPLVDEFEKNPRIRFGIGLALDETAWVLARAKLFIGADSGPLHLATALGTPCVGLFGPAPPDLTGPPVEVNRYLYKKVECSPCDQEDCVRKWQPCMTLISVDEVFEKVVQVYGAFRKSSARRAPSLPNSA